MQAKCGLIIKFIEDAYPLDLSEEWDNSGLQVGDPGKIVSRVLISLDMDEVLLKEALEQKADMVITHHPLLLKAIKQIREDYFPGKLLIPIIKSGITVYSAHTNLDSAGRGVSSALAKKLSLTNTIVLKSASEEFLKLVVFVPVNHVERVREALARAGAGWIGNYNECSFMLKGTGTFRPLGGANPYIGRQGDLEKVEEIRLETILPSRIKDAVIRAMITAHPYEEVAFDLYPLENSPVNSGIGRIGCLENEIPFMDFIQIVKNALPVSVVRYGGPPERKIRKVAVCGGKGSSLWSLALSGGADVLVTGDIGYHDAKDMLAAGISFIDPGHYATESVVLLPLAEYLRSCCRENDLHVDIIVSSRMGDPFVWR